MTKKRSSVAKKNHACRTPMTPPSRLLTLPYDVREYILSYCVTRRARIDIRWILLDVPSGRNLRRPAKPGFPLGLALTCQQMYWETTYVFSRWNSYQSNGGGLVHALRTFEDETPDMLTRRFTTASWLHMQKLELDCCTITMWP